MSPLESPDYQAAHDLIKGNEVIAMMAAGVATVPLAELADEDGAPRWELVLRAKPRLRPEGVSERG